MALDIVTTVDLLPVVQTIRPQTYFFRDRFFSRTFQSDKQAIAFEELPTEQRPAPFVLPTAQGRVMKLKGRISKAFTPAYVKPKFEVDPNMNIVLQRQPGDPIGGAGSVGANLERAIAYTMELGSDMCDRREEIMCAQAVINGSITVVGEDYPAVTVDFGRDASLTSVLTGTARWGQSASAPLTNLGALRTAAFRKSSRAIGDVIMGLDAFALFFADQQVKDMLSASKDYRVTTSDSHLSLFSDGSTPLEYRGRLAGPDGQGALNVWTYAQDYEDYDGTIRNIMDPLDVVGVGRGDAVDGYMCYGAIKDADAGLAAVARFPKMWKNPDPSVVYTMVQSSPLPVPTRPNASFRIRVA